jgi:hypothetical protein
MMKRVIDFIPVKPLPTKGFRRLSIFFHTRFHMFFLNRQALKNGDLTPSRLIYADLKQITGKTQ